MTISTQPYLEVNLPELVSDIQFEFERLNKIESNAISFGPYRSLQFYRPEDEYRQFDYLFEKYPFLFKHSLLFILETDNIGVLHRDNLPNPKNRIRSVSLNIPISGCSTEWKTEFYDVPPEDMHWNAAVNAFVPNSTSTDDYKKVGEYYLKDKPVLVNTQVPHCIIPNKATKPRISLSWTTTFEDWDEAVAFFSQYATA